MIILVDMDNTLVDFDAGLLEAWKKMYPGEYFVPLEERRTFHPHKDYPAHLQEKYINFATVKAVSVISPRRLVE